MPTIICVSREADDWVLHAEELKALKIEVPVINNPKFKSTIRVLGIKTEAQMQALQNFDWIALALPDQVLTFTR